MQAIEERIRQTLKVLYGRVERALQQPRTSLELCAMIDDDPIRTMTVLDDMLRYGRVVERDGRYQATKR